MDIISVRNMSTHSFKTLSYTTDTGASQMIIDGRIKLKNDSEISHFSAKEVVFKDGSSIPADGVILATG